MYCNISLCFEACMILAFCLHAHGSWGSTWARRADLDLELDVDCAVLALRDLWTQRLIRKYRAPKETAEASRNKCPPPKHERKQRKLQKCAYTLFQCVQSSTQRFYLHVQHVQTTVASCPKPRRAQGSKPATNRSLCSSTPPAPSPPPAATDPRTYGLKPKGRRGPLSQVLAH